MVASFTNAQFGTAECTSLLQWNQFMSPRTEIHLLLVFQAGHRGSTDTACIPATDEVAPIPDNEYEQTTIVPSKTMMMILK